MKKILFTRFAARIDTTENQQRIYIYSCNFLSFPRRRILSQNRTVSISIRFYKQSSVPGYNFRHSKRLDIHPVKARMKGFKPDFECGTLLFSQKEANYRRFSPEASKNNCIRSLVIAYSMSSTHTHTEREIGRNPWSGTRIPRRMEKRKRECYTLGSPGNVPPRRGSHLGAFEESQKGSWHRFKAA